MSQECYHRRARDSVLSQSRFQIAPRQRRYLFYRLMGGDELVTIITEITKFGFTHSSDNCKNAKVVVLFLEPRSSVE